MSREPRSDADTDALERALAPLRESFRRRLPDRLAELESQLEAARSGGAPEADAARLCVHTLRGTAGSYGFAGIAAAATALEQALERSPSEAATALVHLRNEITTATRR